MLRASQRQSPSSREAYTLIELLAVIFIIAVVTAVHEVVRGRLGQGAAFVASALAVIVCALLVVFLYRWSWRRDRQRLAELRENCRSVYRVKELPAEPKSIVKPDGAQIHIGDYGWDARPNRRDGLVHLQGLTLRWQVVWHAGFRPDQIQKVATKPASQYEYWAPYWAKKRPPPPCPFPVCERSTPTMGLPHHSGRYFVDYPSQYYQSASDVPERRRDDAA
jgi:prepilin-type N-terminal cleavage/methylation domain-containing protein